MPERQVGCGRGEVHAWLSGRDSGNQISPAPLCSYKWSGLVRASRTLGLVLTWTPELRRGASLDLGGLEDWRTGFAMLCSRSQQGTSSHFCLSPSNLVARKSRGSWGNLAECGERDPTLRTLRLHRLKTQSYLYLLPGSLTCTSPPWR